MKGDLGLDSRLRDILDLLHQGAYCIDRDGFITYWNPAAETLTGYTAQDALGRRCRDDLLLHVSEESGFLCAEACPMVATTQDGQYRQAEVYLQRADGSRCAVRIRTAPLIGRDGVVEGAVQVFLPNDLTAALRYRLQELERLAMVDELTGLASRRMVEETIRARLLEFRRYGWPVAVLLADVDHFKRINDTYGHNTGDEVLRVIGRTLTQSVRPFDLVGRWGGDEFIVVAANVAAPQLSAIANRLLLLVQASRPRVNGHRIGLSVSIGAATATETDTPSSLIGRADTLMYASKRSGRNRVTLSAA